jgi:HD-GYP domain-containing protein (c-di-GMP phosphodiesterase class II)
MATVLLGYEVIHVSLPGSSAHASKLGLLILCAVLFILIDFVVFSIFQSFVFEEAFIPMLKTAFREGIFIESTQYLIAILGALSVDEDIWALGLLVIPLVITYFAFKNIKELQQETLQMLNDMADTVDLRDIYTGGHSKRVADLVRETLDQLKVGGPEATLIEVSARLHDIGKIGIPETILLKPGKLSAEEMAVMQSHPQRGADLISKYKDFSRGASIILHHHERWDGEGYPGRLKGYEIPFGARVIAVADSFDAMTSDRPYRKALSVQQAIQTLLEGRGTQWEPVIVNAFVDMMMCQLGEKLPEHLSELRTPSTLSQTACVTS